MRLASVMRDVRLTLAGERGLVGSSSPRPIMARPSTAETAPLGLERGFRLVVEVTDKRGRCLRTCKSLYVVSDYIIMNGVADWQVNRSLYPAACTERGREGLMTWSNGREEWKIPRVIRRSPRSRGDSSNHL